MQILHIRIFAQIRCPRAASVVMAKKDTEVPDAEVEKNEEEDPHNDEKDDEPGQKEDDEPGQKEEASEEGDGDQSTISLKKPASKLAKQKAKEKAKAKLSPKLMKRPASSSSALPKQKKPKYHAIPSQDEEDEDEETQPVVMKKPASKGNGVIQTIQKKPSTNKVPKSAPKSAPKSGPKSKSKTLDLLEKFKVEEPEEDDSQEKGEEETPETDPEEEPDKSRDRSKSNKFFVMMKRGDLPHAVLQAWNEASSRTKQTELINSLFVKQGRNYVVDPNYELPSTYRKTRETERTDSAKDSQSGFGKMIFCRKYGLTEEDLEQCVASGEVRAFKSGGVTLYAAVNVQMESGVNKKTKEELGMDEKQLNAETSKAFMSVFENLEPTVNLEGPSSARPTTSRKPLPGNQSNLQIGLIMCSCLFGSCFLRIGR